MRSLGSYPHGKRLIVSLLLALLSLSAACGTTQPTAGGQAPAGTPPPTAAGKASSVAPHQPTPPLPGEQYWKNNVSSLLFGTNDTQEWSTDNIETNASFQQALKDAHFTLMRTFFFDRSLADNHATTDAEIAQRLATVANSGMVCLGVLANIFDVAFMKHVVSYAGSRCLLYEFGNEPDYNGISATAYLQQWNTVIPQLRQINPQARFIGPVQSTSDVTPFLEDFLNGVKASGVLPDAISFHWYPCWQDSEQSCLGKAGSVSQAIASVRAVVKEILGRDLPLGITEWNYDPGNPPPAYGDQSDFITQFSTTALKAMIQSGLTFACQFDAASYAGYGHLDLFDIDNNRPKPQYFAIKALIAQYWPGGTADVSTPAASTSPLISRNKPAFCSADNDGPGGPEAITDGHYGNWAFWHGVQGKLPGWCAIHLAAGPTRLLLTWESDYTFDYLSESGTGPQDYTIAVSADSTNGADGHWQTVVQVSGNHARAREHLFPFAGMSWVKMTVTAVQPQNSQHEFMIDEIDLYDASSAATLKDSFFCLGDSITAIAFNRFDENQPALPEDVHAAYPQYFPALVDGGIGGWTTQGALQDLSQLLALNPDMHYWLVSLGTNDAFSLIAPETYRANLQALIDQIKAAGHVPIIPHIPYLNRADASGQQVNAEIQRLNAVIDQLTQSNGLLAGPDLYQLFRSHPAYFDSDGIHPSAAGAIAINQAWFEALRSALYGQS
jgi:lysophospholipase L1-like esterase